MKINWIDKKSSGPTYGHEEFNCGTVKRSYGRKGNKPTTRFILSNEAVKKITSTGYIKIGFASGRVYFEEATSKKGYKLQKNTNNSQKVRLSQDYKIAGKGRLEFDAENNCYYGIVKDTSEV